MKLKEELAKAIEAQQNYDAPAESARIDPRNFGGIPHMDASKKILKQQISNVSGNERKDKRVIGPTYYDLKPCVKRMSSVGSIAMSSNNFSGKKEEILSRKRSQFSPRQGQNMNGSF